MQIYGIIGYPLGHSCSPRYFNEKFQKENIAAEYRSFEMPDIRQLSTLLQQTPDLCGFNVTIPHKGRAFVVIVLKAAGCRAFRSSDIQQRYFLFGISR